MKQVPVELHCNIWCASSLHLWRLITHSGQNAADVRGDVCYAHHRLQRTTILDVVQRCEVASVISMLKLWVFWSLAFLHGDIIILNRIVMHLRINILSHPQCFCLLFFWSVFVRRAACPQCHRPNLISLAGLTTVSPTHTPPPVSPLSEGNPKVMLIGWDSVENATVIS